MASWIATGARRPAERVLVLGDSFVQPPVPLDAGFGRQLDALLGPEVEVLNLGVPGAGTATRSSCSIAMARAEPDLVVLGFLVANDAFNNHPLLDTKPDKPFFQLVDEDLVPVGLDAGLGALARGPLWQRSLVGGWGAQSSRTGGPGSAEAGGGLPLDLRVYDPDWPIRRGLGGDGALVAAVAARAASRGAGFGSCSSRGGRWAAPRAGSRDRAMAELAAWTAGRQRAAAACATHDTAVDLRAAEAQGAPRLPAGRPLDGGGACRGRRERRAVVWWLDAISRVVVATRAAPATGASDGRPVPDLPAPQATRPHYGPACILSPVADVLLAQLCHPNTRQPWSTASSASSTTGCSARSPAGSSRPGWARCRRACRSSTPSVGTTKGRSSIQTSAWWWWTSPAAGSCPRRGSGALHSVMYLRTSARTTSSPAARTRAG